MNFHKKYPVIRIIFTLNIELSGQVISDASIVKEEIIDKSNHTGENILTVDNAKFNIIINGPWIRNLKLPSCILQGCLVYPSKYEHQFGVDELTVFQWSRQVGTEFVPVGQGKLYCTMVKVIQDFLEEKGLEFLECI